MNDCVLGIDLGTSSVKVSCIDKNGQVVIQKSIGFKVDHPKKGYCEQNPEIWFSSTVNCIKYIVNNLNDRFKLVGCSFSGQMHSLVLINKKGEVIRPAILWNDTRNREETNYLNRKLKAELIAITGNKATEGFTLTKLLWVKNHEPQNFKKIYKFMMPKDYVRFRMTGKINTDYSDGTGTIMMDIKKGCWSKSICDKLDIPISIFPPLVKSTDFIGYPTNEFCKETGLPSTLEVFAGCADNAAAALGTGLIDFNKVMCSIGTSGVILAREDTGHSSYEGTLQMESHAIAKHFYSMGVTLSAGNSLRWLKDTFFSKKTFSEMMEVAKKSSIGSNGLLFSPYIDGERTPYTDSKIRGSFIGISSKSSAKDFIRAVVEGVTFSLNDLLEIYKKNGRNFDLMICTGGGAQSTFWLQLQANVFNIPVVRIKNEQGPGTGAAMIASMGCHWFESWNECVERFINYDKRIEPIPESVQKYKQIYAVYHKIYRVTKSLCSELSNL